MPDIKEIIQRAKEYLPNLNEERVLNAYYLAEKAHSGQKRFSGEPYIVHPLSVASILLEFHPDENTLISAFLHDVVEDTKHTLDEIEQWFGKEVRYLCYGMQKLSKVRSKLNDPQVENLRKLFLAMAKDFRVVLLKLCDRLHNMQTLKFVNSGKQARIAQETLNIYAPIAARLGIYRLKSQLEDLCFQYLYHEDFNEIQAQLAKTVKWREKYIEAAKSILIDTLAREGIQARVDGRVKSAYSIYRKLNKKNKTSISEIFDVFAMRIIIPDIYKYGKEYTGHIYTVLGIIHKYFTPLANRFKDYIAVPKVNGYRSLHTTVMGLGSKIHAQPTEIQIRTESMHKGAELGIAAHWLYEEIEKEFPRKAATSFEEAEVNSFVPYFKIQKDWIVGLQKIENEIKSNQELIENLQVDIFHDRIFVLTPRGDVKDLPAGATPVDFAYSVHTEIGHHCIGAKVNGNIVPLDYELKSGEVVEIITRKNAHPSQQWLAFVKTTHTRNHIRDWFKNLDETRHIRSGKELFNQKLKHFGMPALDENLSILKRYNNENLSMKQRQDLLVEIGKGSVLASAVLKKIFTTEEILSGKVQIPAKDDKTSDKKNHTPRRTSEISIGGEKNMPYQFVKCCDASPNDELVGYITRGRGVSVHKKDCQVMKNTKDGRQIPVSVHGKSTYHIQITVEAIDRVGFLRDVSQVIADNGVNILDLFQREAKKGMIALDFVLEINNFDQLEILLSKLEKVSSVRRAFKVNCESRFKSV